MSRRMMFVVALSALAGLAVAFMIGGDKRVPRPAGTATAPAPSDNPANDLEKALRKAMEGGNTR